MTTLVDAVLLIAIPLILVGMIFLPRWGLKKGWPRRIVLSGYFLPIVVGIVVRQYLEAAGASVMPWSWILSWFYRPGQLLIVLIVLAYWDFPFLAVAAVAGKWGMDDERKRAPVYAGLCGTLVLSIVLFAELWRNVEGVFAALIVIPILILPGTLFGLGAGWLFARYRYGKTRPSARP